MASVKNTLSAKRAVIAIFVVAALGYFVDCYDLIIFSVVRRASLASLNVAEDQMLAVGLWLLDIQLVGVLVGGVAWGILADKFGRLSVLFGTILIYSIANILNAYVSSLTQYEILRFIAGFGLAGELGVGITIVSETVTANNRGYATMGIASIGLLGAVLASQIGLHCDWRTAYLTGGILGIGLLVLRWGVSEAHSLRESMKQKASLAVICVCCLVTLFYERITFSVYWRAHLCTLSLVFFSRRRRSLA